MAVYHIRLSLHLSLLYLAFFLFRRFLCFTTDDDDVLMCLCPMFINLFVCPVCSFALISVVSTLFLSFFQQSITYIYMSKRLIRSL